MRKRKTTNMYISYNKSYQRRRGNGSVFFNIILVVILASALGVATYYTLRIKAGGEQRLNKNGLDLVDDSQNNNEVIAENNNMEPATEIINVITGEDKDKDKVIEDDKDKLIEEDEIVIEVDTREPVLGRGIYVTSRAIMDKRDELINLVDTTEVNAMVIDVKDDNGRITFMMDSPKAKEIDSTTNTISDIDELLKLLTKKDIYPIARVVAFKDPLLAEMKQELAIKNKDGSVYRDNNGECWINPYEKQVWDYLIEVSSMAAEAGFKEIQFDYIRFPTGKGMAEADFGPLAEDKTKEDIILEFTQYAYENLKPLGVFVSADVYGTIISSSIDAGLVGQNYVEMAKHLDYICPMIYPSHFAEGNYGVEYPDLEPYKIVRKVMTASRTKLDQIPEGEHRAIVRPWLQDFTASWVKNYQVYGGLQLREQIAGVYGVGYKEWLLWNAAGNYSVYGLYGN